MEISQYTWYDSSSLITKLREVTLLNDNNQFIYKNTSIKLEEIITDEPLPCQFYMLKQTIDNLKQLQIAFKKLNIDIFHLHGYIEYFIKGEESPFTLLPPIVEYQKERSGYINALINDGIHRIYLARTQSKNEIEVIKISNVSTDYPFVGYPNYNGWNGVDILNSTPDIGNKRSWRFSPDIAYSYYRNMNSAFINVGAPRPPGNVEKKTKFLQKFKITL